MRHDSFNIFLFFILVLLFGSTASFMLPAPLYGGLHTKDVAVPGEFLLKFSGNDRIYKIQSVADVDTSLVLAQAEVNSEIEFIEPNFVFTATTFPNDPDRLLQHYLTTIDVQTAWSKELLARELERNNQEPVIAVLDTGIDLDHPDLVDKIWNNAEEIPVNGRDDDGNGFIDDVSGWDFVSNDNDPNPDFTPGYDNDAVNHGTLVAGIAAAATHNDQGISGVSWFGQVIPLRVLNSQGAGDVFSVIQAIDYAVANGADVINMSFIGSNFSQALSNAIQRAYDQGVIVVAAAGNTDPKVNGINLDQTPSYPVCFDGQNGENIVIGVASVSRSLVKSPFSNFGNCIDISAPGENFYSTQVYELGRTGFDTPYNGFWSGTSLSAPLVSGTLATMKSLRPSIPAAELIDFLLATAQDISRYDPAYQGKLGQGLLDIGRAIEATLGQRPKRISSEAETYIVAGLGFGSFPQLKILRQDGSEFKSFFAYSPYFQGAINVAVGDVNSDGRAEIITGAGAGGGPHVRVFNIEGQVVSQFFAYDKNLRGGVNVAVGDFDGDGRDEIITGSGRGSPPEVKIFDYEGNLVRRFLAYDENFLGGVKVAIGDVNSDGRAEIITGAGAGGGPHVRVFNIEGQVVSQFFAFNKNFTGGINIAVGDIHGDGQSEIIVTVEANALPTVRVFSYRGGLLVNFFAAEPFNVHGLYVAAADLDADGRDEIITGSGIGGSSQVRIFNQDGSLYSELLAHPLPYSGGARLSVIHR